MFAIEDTASLELERLICVEIAYDSHLGEACQAVAVNEGLGSAQYLIANIFPQSLLAMQEA